jgi:hypothetical protein
LVVRYAEPFFHKAFSSFFPVLPALPVVILLNPGLEFTYVVIIRGSVRT